MNGEPVACTMAISELTMAEREVEPNRKKQRPEAWCPKLNRTL
jgi:hypothetical protein